MNNFWRNSALSLLVLAGAGCSTNEPLWATNPSFDPVIGSLQETLSVSALTVPQGGSATLTVTVVPYGGFTGLIQFAPVLAQPGIVLSPESVDIEGTEPAVVTMTISASADSTADTQSIVLAAAAGNQAAEATLALTVTQGD